MGGAVGLKKYLILYEVETPLARLTKEGWQRGWETVELSFLE